MRGKLGETAIEALAHVADLPRAIALVDLRKDQRGLGSALAGDRQAVGPYIHAHIAELTKGLATLGRRGDDDLLDIAGHLPEIDIETRA
mgnify:CR=1 FL=1